MTALAELVQKGGPVMYAIMALSVVLYSRCFKLLLSLRRARRQLARDPALTLVGAATARQWQLEARAMFRHQRMALGAMIAAAPLLGLLGTVSGMVRTFESLAGRGSEKSMEGLAAGISEVLVATESGLAVAIPALLVVYLAHREVHDLVRRLSHLESAAPREALS